MYSNIPEIRMRKTNIHGFHVVVFPDKSSLLKFHNYVVFQDSKITKLFIIILKQMDSRNEKKFLV